MTNSFNMFDLIMLAMGAYVLYAAITGRGRLYAVENLKKDKADEFKKVMRRLYAVLGAVMMLNAAASLVKNGFYEMYEVTPATEAARAVYAWKAREGMSLGAFSFLTTTVLDVLAYVFLGLSMAVIVGMIVYIRKVTEKRAPGQAQSGEQQKGASPFKQPAPRMPSSAFNYSAPAEPAAAEAPATEASVAGSPEDAPKA